MKLNNLRYELRRKVSEQKETVDGASGKKGKRWVSRRTEWTSRDGLWTVDWGLKDQRLWNVHLVAHGHGRQTVFWPGYQAKFLRFAPSTASSSLAFPSLPFRLPNNQDAKNEKLFATHTQIFLQFSFCYRLNS